MYDIKYHREVQNDLKILSSRVFSEVMQYFDKLRKDYYKYSQPLGDKDGRNLSDCRKTYFCNAEYRIISKLEDGKINIINIVAVGKRDNFEVYDIANKRINK